MTMVIEADTLVITDKGMEQVRAIVSSEIPGLGLHRRIAIEDEWKVTHLASGKCFDLELASVDEAMTFAMSVAGLANWRDPLDAIIARDRRLQIKVRSHVRRWVRRREERRAAKIAGSIRTRGREVFA